MAISGVRHAPATLEMKLVIVLLAPAILALRLPTAAAFSTTAAAFSPQLQPAGHAASFVPGSIFSRGPLRRRVFEFVAEKPPRRLLGHRWVLAQKLSRRLGVAQDDRQPRGPNRVVAHVKRQTPPESEMPAQLQSPTTTLVLRFAALLIATVIEAVVWAMGAQG
jgi:hypothetical protein